MRRIDELAIRYHRHGFGYYFVRTSWPTIVTSTVAWAGLLFIHEWWYWTLSAVLLVVWFFLVRAARGAWKALRDLGGTIEGLGAIRGTLGP